MRDDGLRCEECDLGGGEKEEKGEKVSRNSSRGRQSYIVWGPAAALAGKMP